ncbi:TIM-barrel domain-containing protein [Croceicoccus marinus]|nr:TIM-barrel domain-containing protein [Croceicoccus marinus]
MFRHRKTMLLCAALSATVLASAAQSALAQGQTVSAAMTAQPAGMEVARADMRMRVTALTDDILRVTIGRDGTMPEDASWAVSPEMRDREARVTPASDGFSTATMRVTFADGRLTVTDMSGAVITQDAPNSVTLDGSAFTLRKAMPQSERYFGMGDKTGGMDRRGKSFVNWNTDAFGFSSADDPIYKSIPFFIGVGGAGGSYGIFLDNTWRTWFDFGHKEEGVLSFGGPDGPIDYYIINGPSTAEVVRRYTDLTGKAPLTPQWALGYQQSRYSYMSAEEVRDVAARLRAERIPTDVMWLDIDFQDRNRPFTVNTKTFPDLPGLIEDLGDDGMKVITITDLHIAAAPNEGYTPYETGTAGDHWVKRADGQTYVAPVWPGPSVFPDFTQESTRDWWGALFEEQLDWGVAGAWNDMNEPAIFETPTKTMPLDNVHRIASDDFAPRTATQLEMHNVYGMENTRATYDGLRTLRPDERAYVMTRASYAGGQRYSVTWTGDNTASWDHLKLSIQQIINLGLSGFSYSGADVSGFGGGPSADLLTRWFQIGAFYPVFRNHSAKDTPRVEPWVDGPEHLAIRRRFIEERYRLMPYLYGLAELNARTGDPILRPVFYDYPGALNAACDQSWTFTVGGAMLVAPPPKPESPQQYDVCLPAGGWYDYWTGLPAGEPAADQDDAPILSATQATGGPRVPSSIVRETPRLDHLPIFVRAGTILPRQAVVQSLSETPAGPLMLDVYPGEDCRGTLYADDGHSMAFQQGGYVRQELTCTVTPEGVSIDIGAREGRFSPWWQQIAVTVHGWDGTAEVRQGRRTLDSRSDAATRTVGFTFDAPSRPTEITVARN